MQRGDSLVNTVRAGFVLKGTSLNKFCLSKAIDVSNAKKALRGSWSGPKAKVICDLLIEASSVEEAEADDQEPSNEDVD